MTRTLPKSGKDTPISPCPIEPKTAQHVYRDSGKVGEGGEDPGKKILGKKRQNSPKPLSLPCLRALGVWVAHDDDGRCMAANGGKIVDPKKKPKRALFVGIGDIF
jgi:hypothetical protein